MGSKMKKIKLHLFIISLLVIFSSQSKASSWDLDGNGNLDALTDGLLLLRHTFELRGNALIDSAMATDSTMSHAQVEQRIVDAYAIADIDGNGEVDALTDALILLRYLFELRGDALIDSAVAENAARASSSDIEQYIVEHISANSEQDNEVGSIKGPAEFIEAFGGGTYEGETFTFPSSAEPWAGFANMDLSLYPFTFQNGGKISFTGSVPSDGSVQIKFRFEKDPHPNHEPLFETQVVTVSGQDETAYTVDFSAQGSKTFNNLIMYVIDRDAQVRISNLMITEFDDSSETANPDNDSNSNDADDSTGGATNDSGSGITGGTVSDVAVIDEAFGGATYEGETFTFPSRA